jgi:hypothetical protein
VGGTRRIVSCGIGAFQRAKRLLPFPNAVDEAELATPQKAPLGVILDRIFRFLEGENGVLQDVAPHLLPDEPLVGVGHREDEADADRPALLGQPQEAQPDRLPCFPVMRGEAEQVIVDVIEDDVNRLDDLLRIRLLRVGLLERREAFFLQRSETLLHRLDQPVKISDDLLLLRGDVELCAIGARINEGEEHVAEKVELRFGATNEAQGQLLKKVKPPVSLTPADEKRVPHVWVINDLFVRLFLIPDDDFSFHEFRSFLKSIARERSGFDPELATIGNVSWQKSYDEAVGGRNPKKR